MQNLRLYSDSDLILCLMSCYVVSYWTASSFVHFSKAFHICHWSFSGPQQQRPEQLNPISLNPSSNLPSSHPAITLNNDLEPTSLVKNRHLKKKKEKNADHLRRCLQSRMLRCFQRRDSTWYPAHCLDGHKLLGNESPGGQTETVTEVDYLTFTILVLGCERKKTISIYSGLLYCGIWRN